MKNHVTTSAAVNRELTAMSETKQVSARDYSRAIIAVTVLTVFGAIITALCIFGIPKY